MKIILSCTTTYERRDLFYYGIQSLLKQSLKPDLFLVNISKKSFLKEAGKPELPNWLQRKEVTINDVEDVGPYTKLIPTLDYADADDLIITVDDDVIYDNDLINKLILTSNDYPESIVCGRARRIEKNFLGNWKNYSHWRKIGENSYGHSILPLGVGGVLYKKKLLDLHFINDRKFLEIAPTTDDLWFRMASLLKNVSVYVDPSISAGNAPLLHKKGLEEVNLLTSKQKSKLSRFFMFLKNRLSGQVGINLTNNDFAWDKINKYVKASCF